MVGGQYSVKYSDIHGKKNKAEETQSVRLV